ncbi:MAG: hypothetical protein CMP43_03855 [Rickettsiales bacterium]|nr:hypothetical protein [Rickettsiales bacterium]
MYKELIFLSFLILFNIFYSLFFSYDKNIEKVSFIIEPGMKLNEISEQLYYEEIISNKFAFKLWNKINFLEKKIKYGEFYIEGRNSIYNVTNKLSSGQKVYRKITLIEGSSKYDLLKILKEIDPKSSLKLYDIPDMIVADTYNYTVTDDSRRILDYMIKTSKRFSENIWEERNKEIPINKISEMHILASIVEKESALKSEKNKIAGVFFNRINLGMRLQSDPTVEFAITMGEKKLDRKLLRKDLKIDSEYNTYMISGLPPSIICFPGKDSLVAVSKPYKSDFLYFVSKRRNGEHFFSTTYKEHLKRIREVKNVK